MITSSRLIRFLKKNGSRILVNSVIVAKHPNATEIFAIFIAPKKAIQWTAIMIPIPNNLKK